MVFGPCPKEHSQKFFREGDFAELLFYRCCPVSVAIGGSSERGVRRGWMTRRHHRRWLRLTGRCRSRSHWHKETGDMPCRCLIDGSHRRRGVWGRVSGKEGGGRGVSLQKMGSMSIVCGWRTTRSSEIRAHALVSGSSSMGGEAGR